MKIDLSANREFVRGATAVLRQEDGSFVLKRLTRAMYDVFQTDPPSPFWDYMIDCPAGIRIEFTTDASELRMKSIYSKPLDKPLYVGETDVVINGGGIKTFRAKPLTDQEEDNIHEFTCPLGETGVQKTVSVYLGNQVPSRILELEINTDKMPHTVAYAQSILFAGDSITQGYFDSPAGCYAARYAAYRNADMHNVSLGGASLIAKAGSAAMAYPWNELVLAYGTNDSGWRTPEDFRAAMTEFLKSVTTRENTKITVISPIPLLLADETRKKKLDVYKQIAAEMQNLFPNVQSVDGCTLVPAEDRYFVDGCHPNAEGMKLYSENLINM